MSMNVLGLSAFYHDSAAALVHDGEVVAAAQQERFSREKFDARFVVETNVVYLIQGDPGLVKTVHDGGSRKPCIVLLSGETLLLRGRHDLAVVD